MKTYQIFLFAALSFAINSCQLSSDTFGRKVSGKAGEVTVVMPENQWQGQLGEEIKNVLLVRQKGLIRPEPMFDIRYLKPESFNGVFETKRNLLITKVSDQFQEATVKISHDVWVDHQLVIYVNGPSIESITAELIQNAEYIRNLILQEERKRSVLSSRSTLNADAMKALENKFNLEMNIPAGYQLFMNKKDFIWIGKEKQGEKLELYFYSYEYTDTNTFTIDYLVKKRNAILGQHIKGKWPGSFMGTELRIEPVLSRFYHNDFFVAELRGAWTMEKGAMGGSFVSVSTVDEQRGKVITMEGMVYHPNEDHRNLLRQLESIIYTFDIVPKGG